MKIGYTEFSFGYAFTENLIRASRTGAVGAPVFPNLVQEAQAGFDVRIDLPACPVFFQYKLPELMVSRRAKEVSTYHLVGIWPKFFRMPLMQRNLSNQHRILINLERQYPGAVHYATPMMETAQDFNGAYNNASVHQSSALFSPGDIGALPDDNPHSVAYRTGLSYGWFCSDPREIPMLVFDGLQQKLARQLRLVRFGSLIRTSSELRKFVRERVSVPMRATDGQLEERIRARMTAARGERALPAENERVTVELLATREMALVGMGLDLMIAQPRAS
jgi:hypothetical protein